MKILPLVDSEELIKFDAYSGHFNFVRWHIFLNFAQFFAGKKRDRIFPKI